MRALFIVALMLPACTWAALTPKSLVVCFDGWRADAVGSAVTPAVARLATDATTIPFLLTSRETPLGTGFVRNVDVAPTVLAHFGIDPAPLRLDGVARVPITSR